jgi:hypothetical protein
MHRNQFLEALKITFAIWAVLMIAVAFVTCATTKPPTPAGCESSLVHQYAPWSQVILSGAVIGCYSLAQSNPVQYAAIRLGAQQAILLLQGQAVTYQQLADVPNLGALLASQLAAIFPPDRYIDQCDRDILLGYLRML